MYASSRLADPAAGALNRTSAEAVATEEGRGGRWWRRSARTSRGSWAVVTLEWTNSCGKGALGMKGFCLAALHGVVNGLETSILT